MPKSLKRATGVALIGALGLFAGLGLGAIPSAQSSKLGQATASNANRVQAYMLREMRMQTRYLKNIDSNVRSLDSSIGTYYSGSVSDDLSDIKSNTYGTCREVGSWYCSR